MIPGIDVAGGMAVAWMHLLLRAAWQGGLALAVAWTLVRLFPRLPAAARCWIWRVAFLKLVTALLPLGAIELPILGYTPPTSGPAGVAQVNAFPVTLAESGAESAPVIEPALPRQSLSYGGTAALLLCALWFAGFAAAEVQLVRQWRAAHALRRRSRLLMEPSLGHECRILCAQLGLGRVPALAQAPNLDCPLLLGIRRPLVVFPADLLAQGDRRPLRMMLAHELAHLRRHDLMWNWLAAAAQCLFYFHPLVWFGRREWRLADEMACDALALSVTQVPVAQYGGLILDMASRRPSPCAILALGVTGSVNAIERRLLAMQNANLSSRRSVAVVLSLLMVVALLTLVPWRVVAQETPSPSTPPVPPTRQVGQEPADPAPPRRDAEPDVIRLAGSVAAATFVAAAPMDGSVRDVRVAEGDRVKKGDLLVQLEDRKLQAALVRARVELQLAAVDVQRLKEMVKANVGSDQELQHAEAKLEAAKIAVMLAEQELVDARIVAPFDGIIYECPARARQVVSRASPLVALVETGIPKVEMRMPERFLPRVKAGQSFEFQADAWPEQRFTGKLSFISPRVDAESRTILLRGTADDPKDQLRPGMFIKVTLRLGEASQ